MREILAVVNRARAADTKRELARSGVAGYTQWPVLGRGRQRGLRDAEGRGTLPFLPKVAFTVIVEDERAQEAIEAILRANQTGQYGDGKMFVSPVAASYRISTAMQVQPAPGVAAMSRESVPS